MGGLDEGRLGKLPSDCTKSGSARTAEKMPGSPQHQCGQLAGACLDVTVNLTPFHANSEKVGSPIFGLSNLVQVTVLPGSYLEPCWPGMLGTEDPRLSTGGRGMCRVRWRCCGPGQAGGPAPLLCILSCLPSQAAAPISSAALGRSKGFMSLYVQGSRERAQE